MISSQTKLDIAKTRTLERLAEKGVFRSLGNAAAAIRQTMRFLPTISKKPSAKGEPVHTRKGLAKRKDAVLFAVDRNADDAVIGFTHSVMGASMSAHEHGGIYLGADFPARPTAAPALDVNLVRFADEFKGSIGE